jgi:hypothetical protein
LSTQDPHVILASFIAQLCDQRPNLWLDLVEDYRKSKSKNTQRSQKLNHDGLQNLLLDVSGKIGDICLFLDAPNESVQSLVILESFGKAMAQHSGMRVCVSSTPDLEIATFAKHHIRYVSVNREGSGILAEIEAYVGSSLNEHDAFRDVPSELRIHTKKAIILRANGSFRWVDCRLRSLAL